jgi:hypothetical protein
VGTLIGRVCFNFSVQSTYENLDSLIGYLIFIRATLTLLRVEEKKKPHRYARNILS